jgi:hypothetical protein
MPPGQAPGRNAGRPARQDPVHEFRDTDVVDELGRISRRTVVRPRLTVDEAARR